MPPGIVEVMPNGFDPARFSPAGPALTLPVEAACTFLFVGGTIWRKGVDLLIAAWSRLAFGPDDDVALVIKDFGTSTWIHGQTAGESIRDYAARGETAPVVYIDDDLPARDVASLYRAAEVLVVPYRGEGFCLTGARGHGLWAAGDPYGHGTDQRVRAHRSWVGARGPGDGCFFAFRHRKLAGPARVQEVDVASLVSALREAAFEPDERLARARCALTASAQHTWAELRPVRARHSRFSLTRRCPSPGWASRRLWSAAQVGRSRCTRRYETTQ